MTKDLNKKKDFVCFYHRADLDGLCSAAIVFKYIKSTEKYKHIKFIGVDYDDNFDEYMDYIGNHTEVVMVDFSFPLNLMENIKKLSKKFVWIDHHISAMEKLSGLRLYGLRSTEFAACELTWKYFFNDSVPKSVHYLSRYDIRDHYRKEILQFQYGVRLEDINLFMNKVEQSLNVIWNYILEDTNTDLYISRGKIVEEYIENQHKKLMNKAFEIKFHGLNCLVLNTISSSKIFEDRNNFRENEYDAYILFMNIDGRYKVSLYGADNMDINLSEIASKYGGGGHARACGFYCDKVYFENGTMYVYVKPV